MKPTSASNDRRAEVAADGPPSTYYAPAERASPDQLREQLEHVAHDPVVDGLMRAIHGLLAVLNEQRQVLALNESLLRLLGLDNAAETLGLRLGQVVKCAHAEHPPAGCGTTPYCMTCGAAIAQATALSEDKATERICAIDTARPLNGSHQLFFRVQACPIRCGDRRILLLFVQDISEDQQRALLERTFYHDVNNLLFGIMGAGELLAGGGSADPQIAENVVQMTRRLAREIDLHRCLVKSTVDKFQWVASQVRPAHVLEELSMTCGYHPSAQGRQLHLLPVAPEVGILVTDSTLLLRVLHNMVINALEATASGGEVRVGVVRLPQMLEFSVWNDVFIPPEIARRIFQRNFSTKAQIGRGLGTYSMKLIGERMLRGTVTFDSQPGQGTTFRLRLPLEQK